MIQYGISSSTYEWLVVDVECAADGTATDSLADDSARVDEKQQQQQQEQRGGGDKAGRAKMRAAKHRHIRASYRQPVIIAIKVLLLFGLAVAYFLSSFFLEQNQFRDQARFMPEHTLLAQRNTMVRDTLYLTRQLALVPLGQMEFRPDDAAAVAGKRMDQPLAAYSIAIS